MKSSEFLKDEISSVLKTDTKDKPLRYINRLRKKIAFLQVCLRYAETFPSEKYLIEEKNRINNRIEKIDQGFKYYLMYNSGDRKELKKLYEKEYEREKLMSQLLCIDYLLN